jgi:pimeloyl-ACP methyl ester carboxylesterase
LILDPVHILQASLGHRPCLAGLWLAAGLLLSACTHDFVARSANPLRAASALEAVGGRPPARLESELQAAIRAQRAGQELAAAAGYLGVLEDPASGKISRFATARLVELCAPALLAHPGGVVRIDGPSRRYLVRLRRGPGPGGIAPDRFVSLEPADRFAVSGVPTFSGNPGLGAPLVGGLPPALPVHVGADPALPVVGLSWPVTAEAVFGPPGRVRSVALELFEPQSFPISGPAPAADYTTPLAVSETRQRALRRGWAGFLRGSEYYPSIGLYPTEPPTPGKTPVILVHGLLSDPAEFRYLRNALAGNAEVRRRYQIWLFYYPTSLPVPYPAKLLRQDMDRFIHQLDPAGIHPALHRIVLVGHSMGGVICRLAVSDGGDAFYRQYYRKPLPELSLTADERELVRQTFYYRASPDVRTVVFIATPHKGSQLALSPLGGLAQLVVRPPTKVVAELRDMGRRNPGALTDPRLRADGSILALSPRNPLVKALAAMPMHTGRVRLHSILGDRGRGGPRERTSDGIVPYASAHLPEAQSEVMVPASHTGTLKRPETAAELIRILHE